MGNLLIYDLLIILASGLVAALICKRLHASVLVGYLVVGAVIGKGGLGWISEGQHEIEYIVEAGVFLLLFSIGLEFSLEELWQLGRNLLIGGCIQMLLVAVPAGALLLALGLQWQAAFLIAVTISFSSTVLVFKSLSEWGHSSLPHGRRAIGILLFQDVALVPLLLIVPLLTGTGKTAGPGEYVVLAASAIIFVVVIIVLRWLLANWIIPLFTNYRSPELVVLFTLVTLGGITFTAYRIGLPPAIGAFAAGLIFSGNRWTEQIDALVLPFRDTFAAVFFVSLGLLLNPQILWDEPGFILGTLVGVIFIKAAAAMIALWATGLQRTTAFGMGIGLAHIGEFAFVLLSLSWKVGVINELDYQRVVTVAVGSLILTPILMKSGLRLTRSSTKQKETATGEKLSNQIKQQTIVIGAGPIGKQLTSRLETIGKNVCLIDLSPINLHSFAQQGFRTVAGDATDADILEVAEAATASQVFVCVPDDEAAIRIIQNIRTVNSQCIIIVRCRYQSNISKLNNAGASRVISEESLVSDALIETLVSV